jgi:serine/threonine-protein kinase RsbW
MATQPLFHPEGPPDGSAAAGPLREERVIDNDRDAIEGCITRVTALMEAMAYPATSMFAMRLAMEEAIVNGFKHGNKEQPGSTVRVQWEATPDEVTVSVEDSGPGFSPDQVPDPTEPDRLEIPSGRGLMLMRAYMTRIWHNERGNQVTMVYARPSAAPDDEADDAGTQ